MIGEERCPADDNEFDVVLASEIIEHLVDTDGFLNELRRTLHGSSSLIVTPPNLASGSRACGCFRAGSLGTTRRRQQASRPTTWPNLVTSA
jgi:2-polyprenyl-3-methyl-5-hydroxy-6-metoxy-1,4-benzoquinol methylase